MERLEVNEYKKDPGVVLVRKYAELETKKGELKNQIKAIEDEQAKIEEVAIEYAEKDNVRVIDGPDHLLAVTIREETCAPTRKENQDKWQKLRDALIAEGKFIEVSTINNNMLNSRLRSWPRDFYGKIKDFLINRVTKGIELKRKR
jgi:hypothetical protein